MKKVLLLVPHEDDELLIGGSLLIHLIRDFSYEVYVFIATNGDYYPGEHKLRVQESISVLKSIGLKEKNIIFGGYGDDWKGTHIYNAEANAVIESHAGFKETYLRANFDEWHYIRHKKHQPYTKAGYLADIRDLLETVLADVIICVDLDAHADHRCLSLLVDEALGDVLKAKKNYIPILLKKFAYQSVLYGKSDFFHYPHKRTLSSSSATRNPYFSWDDRISYGVPKDCDTVFLHNNYLFKLSKLYRTQRIWQRAPAFINSDIVYWKRNTNNKLLHSEISVSSGNPKYINDFKLIDSLDIRQKDCSCSNCCWRPDTIDKKREISIRFKACSSVRHVLIYFNCPQGLKGNYSVELQDDLSNTQIIYRSVDSPNDYFIDHIILPENNVLKSFVLKMDKLEGTLGIGEIEAFNDYQDIPFQKYLFEEKKTTISDNLKRLFYSLLLFLERNFFKFEILFTQ